MLLYQYIFNNNYLIKITRNYKFGHQPALPGWQQGKDGIGIDGIGMKSVSVFDIDGIALWGVMKAEDKYKKKNLCQACVNRKI